MTNGEIDRLGQRIGNASGSVSDSDLDLLQEYRRTFQEPIARVFNFVLSAARKIDRQSVVTYRIKRIDTIIEKLKRFKLNANGRMAFSNMWDIAGCRCILNTAGTDKLYQLLEVIKQEYGADCKVNDHVNPPKPSGYRSLHVYVKDKLSQKRIEIQIRNRSQHNWATLVEIVDLLYGTHQKEQGASNTLGRFLSLYSRTDSLSDAEFSEMLKLERKMKVFENMSETLSNNYLKIRIQWLQQRQSGSYFVITANKKGSKIQSFPTFRSAEEEYYNSYLSNKDCNIVLTHLQNPDFDQISMAYSNYMLAMHSFFDDYRILVGKKIIECVRDKSYFKFFRDFKIYNKNLKYYFKNLMREVNSIEACETSRDVSRNQLRKWIREVNARLQLWQNETRSFLGTLFREARGNFFERWLIRNRGKRMAKAVLAGQEEA